jgi:hypothetical protein
MASDEARARMLRIITHATQVGTGLLPPDAPPDFVRPEGLDERGRPWWFGPDYAATPETLAEFSKPMGRMEGPELTREMVDSIPPEADRPGPAWSR